MKRRDTYEATIAKDYSTLRGKAKIPISVTVAETWSDSRGIIGKTLHKIWAELLNNLGESLAPVKPLAKYFWLHFGQFHFRFCKSSFILFICLKAITLKLWLAMEVFCLCLLFFCSTFLFFLAEVQTCRLVMVLFLRTVKQNFCFSHFSWTYMSLWIARDGRDSLIYVEQNMLWTICWSLPQGLVKRIFYLVTHTNTERMQARRSWREVASPHVIEWQCILKHPDLQYCKMQGHFSYRWGEEPWYFIVQHNSTGLNFLHKRMCCTVA